jgi:penicillin-binding protein 1A
MTGGSLPAMTWHDVMETAHQGIELKPMPGLKEVGRAVAQTPAAAPVNPAASAAGKLSRRSFEVIGGVNGLFRTVEANGGALRPADVVAEGARPARGRVATP